MCLSITQKCFILYRSLLNWVQFYSAFRIHIKILHPQSPIQSKLPESSEGVSCWLSPLKATTTEDKPLEISLIETYCYKGININIRANGHFTPASSHKRFRKCKCLKRFNLMPKHFPYNDCISRNETVLHRLLKWQRFEQTSCLVKLSLLTNKKL